MGAATTLSWENVSALRKRAGRSRLQLSNLIYAKNFENVFQRSFEPGDHFMAIDSFDYSFILCSKAFFLLVPGRSFYPDTLKEYDSLPIATYLLSDKYIRVSSSQFDF